MPLRRQLEERLAELREELVGEYGWTRLELDVEVDDQGGVRVVGVIAALGLHERIRRALAPLTTALVLELRVAAPTHWQGLTRTTRVWRHHPARLANELATELWIEDGPVGVLASDGAATLVQARDATVGWILDPLGPATPARPIPAGLAIDEPGLALVEAARAWLGTPYRLGGATHEHVDCSALVQRSLVRALGLLVPKNSNDQLRCGGGGRRGERESEPGDLLFIHSRREGRTHVGIAAPQGRVVQASRTRNRVVEVAQADYFADAAWFARVPLADLQAWAASQIGREVLALPR